MKTRSICVLNLIYIQSVWQLTSQWTDIWFEDGGDRYQKIWTTGDDVQFEYTSDENACVTGTCIKMYSDDAWMYRSTNIANYSRLRVQYDLTVVDLLTTGSCRVHYAYDSFAEKSLSRDYDRDLPDAPYFDNQTIALEPPFTKTTLWLWFELHRTSIFAGLGCYWDNIRLQGIIGPQITGYPTLSPNNHTTTNWIDIWFEDGSVSDQSKWQSSGDVSIVDNAEACFTGNCLLTESSALLKRQSTNIVVYSDLRLRFDVSMKKTDPYTTGLDGWCNVSYAYESEYIIPTQKALKAFVYPPRKTGIISYGDQYVSLPSASFKSAIYIWFEPYVPYTGGLTVSQDCWWDNIYLQGLLDPSIPDPTTEPTVEPSLPSKQPTRHPTTGQPSQQPTLHPTDNPSESPTGNPSQSPTQYTSNPTQATVNPSESPTKFTSPPTNNPSESPTDHPSSSPTQSTSNPTRATLQPSKSPDATDHPSQSPMQSASNPTKPITTVSPDPSNAPNVPSFPPYYDPYNTIGETGSIVDQTSDMQSAEASASGGESSNFGLITLLIAIVLLVFIIVAFVDGRKSRPNDYFNAASLISAAFQMIDCASDVFFAIQITKHPEFVSGSPLFILFILSLFFILMPVIVSVAQLYSIISNHWNKNDRMRAWLRDGIYQLLMLSFVCGSTFAAIHICSSNAFDLNLFSIPLSKLDKVRFQCKRVYSVVLFENVPQLMIAIAFIAMVGFEGENNAIVYVSMAFSAISIFMMVMSSLTTKELLDTQDYSVILLNVTGSMFGDNLKRCRTRTNGIRRHMSVLLGADESLVEIPKPRQIHHGFRLEFILLINHVTVEELGIKDKILDSDTHTLIAEFISQCWELSGLPSVEVKQFKQNTSSKQKALEMADKNSTEAANLSTQEIKRPVSIQKKEESESSVDDSAVQEIDQDIDQNV